MPGLGGAELRKEGKFRIGLDYSYRNGDSLIERTDVDHKNKLAVENLWTRLTFDVEYGLTDRITLKGQIPYVMNARQEGYANNHYTADGFGDLVLGGRYWFLEPDLAGWNVYAELDLRLPTGDDNETWKGKPKKAYIQPGLGQWGLLPSAGVYKGFGDFSFTASAGGVLNFGRNHVGYESADAFVAAIGGSWTPLKLGPEKKTLISASLLFSGVWIHKRDTRDGEPVKNTGGEWIYATPGVSLSPDGGNFSVFLAVPITLYARVHRLQCYEDYSVDFGVQYRF